MSEEMWHVQIEPGDVKTVTLEQMDDMYRLELISASTLVWQPGMAKALPLSVIAGIDDEESDVMEIEPELIPEPVYSTRSVAPAPASVTARSVASVVALPITSRTTAHRSVMAYRKSHWPACMALSVHTFSTR